MSTPTMRSPVRPGFSAVSAKLLLFLVLIGLTATACFVLKPAAGVSESGVNMKWPEKVFDFTGKDEPPGEAELKLLPPDTEFAKKLYTNPKGEQLNAQIVLSGVEHRSIHRPEVCLKGQGWNVRGGQVMPVRLKSGHTLNVMVLDITHPGRASNGATIEVPAIYAYFFASKDVETAKHFDRIAITNLDLLFRNKSHRWAYVITMAQVLKGIVPDGKDREQTLQLIKDFLRETAPQILKSESSAPALAVGNSPSKITSSSADAR